MTDFSDILSFYRTGKLSKFALEAELSRGIDTVRASVSIDDDVNASAGTYAIAIIPDMRSGTVKDTIVIDRKLIDSQIAVGKIVELITAAAKSIPAVNMRYLSFMSSHKNTETSYLECIEFALNSYKTMLDDINADLSEDSAISQMIRIAHTIDINALNTAILSAHTGKETAESCVEYILNKRLLPKAALSNAEDMFKIINNPAISGDGVDPLHEVPAENKFYAKLASVCDGLINPQYHKDMDPFYIPDSNLNK